MEGGGGELLEGRMKRVVLLSVWGDEVLTTLLIANQRWGSHCHVHRCYCFVLLFSTVKLICLKSTASGYAIWLEPFFGIRTQLSLFVAQQGYFPEVFDGGSVNMGAGNSIVWTVK